MSEAGKHARYNMPFYKIVGGLGRGGHRTRADNFREKELAQEYRAEANQKEREWWNKLEEDAKERYLHEAEDASKPWEELPEWKKESWRRKVDES